MKNAPTTNSNESALDKRQYTIGTLPKRQDTVRAAVLATALEGHSLTGMEAVFGQYTTRLSAVVHALESDYGWRFCRDDRVVDTKDGRIASIVAYSLPQAVIEAAFATGARFWINEVKSARAKLKQHAIKRKQEAVKAKAVRAQLPKQDPRQRSLWGDA